MFAKTAIVAFFAAFSAAQLHAPTTLDESGGNAITRPLNEAVTAGTPFTITWTPSYPNSVSLLLLKGPSNNVVPVGEPIAEGIENTGSFTWTPPADFGAGLSETTGYGIQIIDDATGLYQYSTQFGITIPEDYEVSSSAAPSTTKGSGGYPTASIESSSAKVTPTYAPTTIVTSSPVLPTSYPAGNSSSVYPTGSMTVKPSASAPAEFPGAASHLQAGAGLFAGVAAALFML